MYVITFYSFKGGVGRTMALANVALELARTGRRVLMVDFDLEAPGLDTFDVLKPERPTPGIVDFVTSYRRTGIAPNVCDFIYEPQITVGTPGRVWVMPTGKQDEQYAQQLYSIDWQQLYSQQDGYLLFEDLKEQWRQKLKPDYVLVDSRTGHTDVGGICTRQLPDAVAILFFPNEQNRRGFEVVVRNVRKEQQESKRPIKMYFIAANVPELDDEESILKDRLNHFRRTIDYPRLDGTIHHYDSLSLLQQTVFTVERPQTKLAREYRRLTEKVISDNLEDRKVVLDVLGRLSTRGGDALQVATIGGVDAFLKKVLTRYRADGEVLYSLAQANQFLGKPAVAESLFADARSLGFETADVLIEQAVSSYATRSYEAAREYLKTAVKQGAGQVFKLERAFTLVLEHDIEFLTEFVEIVSSSNVPPIDRIRMARLLATQDRALEAVDRLLTPIVRSTEQGVYHQQAEFDLALCRIAQKRFEEAMKLIAPERTLLAEMGVGENFNYAMAEWGATNTLPTDLFRRVIAIHELSPRDPESNYLECLAIALWADGRGGEAQRTIEASRGALSKGEKIFSAWRYLYVDGDDFEQDLNSLKRMVADGGERPLVFG
jgi:MinD-like ATPase involved in chromosome partitioning or flagellar assembly/Flp pilus assembly protein TadD